MIHFVTGNIFDSCAKALVNTVNTLGVMGKGIALQFKKQYPNNYKIYKEACEKKLLSIGQLLVTEEVALMGEKKIIINFPTKTNWRLPSEYEYIKLGLETLKKIIVEKKIDSIAIPPLGAGNGGLDWLKVKKMITEALNELECDIYIYNPNDAIQEVLNSERVKLTPARAMLLSVLYEMVRHGELVSEFAAEKSAYFLQRFGAKDIFKLEFMPNFYGPYSGKVRHVLYYLNGSYIKGYSSKDKKPFDELSLVMEAENEVTVFLKQPENQKFEHIAEKTKKFLKGYYSPFGLELLSTIDFIILEKNKVNPDDILMELENWSDRKRTLFANPAFIKKALSNINEHLL
jgi:O-acetyl-ADP-ribose deacetylase (regulator of RNase III)